MDKFTSYMEAVTVLKECGKKLTAYDFNLCSLVAIIHEDGTNLYYKSAFTREWKDWIFVFTEHHGSHVYHKSDIASYGTYIYQDHKKQEDTGHVDKCEFCNKEFRVENLNYGSHPGIHFDDSKYYVFCRDCKDIVGSDHEELWRHLNKTGAYNMEKDCAEPWGFVWGRDDIDHIKKACATVMADECIDRWLDTSSPSFRKTPRKAIENGDYEDVLIAIYSMGTGEFS